MSHKTIHTKCVCNASFRVSLIEFAHYLAKSNYLPINSARSDVRSAVLRLRQIIGAVVLTRTLLNSTGHDGEKSAVRTMHSQQYTNAAQVGKGNSSPSENVGRIVFKQILYFKYEE